MVEQELLVFGQSASTGDFLTKSFELAGAIEPSEILFGLCEW